MNSLKASLICCALAVAIAPTAANACITIDKMRSVSIFHDTAQKTIPEGMVRLKVRIKAKQQAASGGYVTAYIVDGAPGSRTVAILAPPLTSCDQLDVPPEGEYYVTGVFAKGFNGRKLYLNGGAIFAARIERSRIVPIPEAPSAAPENSN